MLFKEFKPIHHASIVFRQLLNKDVSGCFEVVFIFSERIAPVLHLFLLMLN